MSATSETTTVVVDGRVYEMGSSERAREAAEWVYEHPDEATQFEDHFADAVIVGTPVGSTFRQQ
ncbi:hypothetical protein QPK32_14955 [Massilia sp. YIM B02763]|uniref:hypothetical protein n=1 Tax=Massilia sp. YIM B02763 TaxID=3050130 RepID=UPI0025B6AFBB|nr:hypothetical protein [Massilia sp. YIM B02763]MDN4054380.1 hypothetical protein [Massilia sp. YIM B02763]